VEPDSRRRASRRAPASELARRYTELLSENLGQPGFRELLIVAHDMDARRDLIFAMLGSAHRTRFFARPSMAEGARQAEAFDLGGVAREHALDALAAALTVPLATEPELVTFSRRRARGAARRTACATGPVHSRACSRRSPRRASSR
jgi:hypothetical protein